MSGRSFRERKIFTFATRLDINGDGRVTFDDFNDMCKRFDAITNASKESKDRFRAAVTEVWNVFLKPLAAEGIAITLNDFVKAHIDMSYEKITELGGQSMRALFESIDVNQDGIISKTEFEDFYRILGIDTKFSDFGFQGIDSNKDGEISKEELANAFIEYLSSEDSTKETQKMFGPLI